MTFLILVKTVMFAGRCGQDRIPCNYQRPGLPGSSNGKESACNAGDQGSIPVLRRSFGEGNVNPLQYSYLENPMDRGAWWATVHGVAKSQA